MPTINSVSCYLIRPWLVSQLCFQWHCCLVRGLAMATNVVNVVPFISIQWQQYCVNYTALKHSSVPDFWIAKGLYLVLEHMLQKHVLGNFVFLKSGVFSTKFCLGIPLSLEIGLRSLFDSVSSTVCSPDHWISVRNEIRNAKLDSMC